MLQAKSALLTGIVASTKAKFLREISIRGQAHRKAIKEQANTAEKTNHCMWLKRCTTTWAAMTMCLSGKALW